MPQVICCNEDESEKNQTSALQRFVIICNRARKINQNNKKKRYKNSNVHYEPKEPACVSSPLVL